MASKDNEGTFGTPLTRLTPAAAPTGLVDQYGRPIGEADARMYGPPSDPIASSATAGVIKRDIPIPLMTRWDPDLIQNALDQHMNGNFSQSAFLCDALMGDDRVTATVGQRMGALFSRPMVTVPCVDGVESDDEEAVEIAEAYAAAWDRMAPLAVLEEIHTWGITEGAVPVEVQWDRSKPIWQPYLKPWHPTHLMWRWDLQRYTITTLDGIEVIEPGDGRWMLYTPHGPRRGWRRACVRPLSTPWFCRRLTWRDWPRYNERHGMPILIAEAPARSDAKLRDQWVRGLGQLGQESVILCPQNVDGTGFDVRMLEAKDRSYESFDMFMGRCDMSIVLTILWQNLTTEVQGGSYAASQTHEGVQQTAARYDNGTLAPCIDEQVARVFAEWNFGRRDKAPKRHWVIEQPADHLASSQAFAAFAAALSDMKAAGFQITVAGVVALAFQFNLRLTIDQIKEVTADAAAGKPVKAPK